MLLSIECEHCALKWEPVLNWNHSDLFFCQCKTQNFNNANIRSIENLVKDRIHMGNIECQFFVTAYGALAYLCQGTFANAWRWPTLIQVKVRSHLGVHMTRQPRSAGATLEGDERLAISIQEVIASKICKHLNIFLAFKMLHHGAQERSPLKKVLKCASVKCASVCTDFKWSTSRSAGIHEAFSRPAAPTFISAHMWEGFN